MKIAIFCCDIPWKDLQIDERNQTRLDKTEDTIIWREIIPPIPNAKSAKNRKEAVNSRPIITWMEMATILDLVLEAKWSARATKEIMAK